nr:NADH dehydrogenase subunit 4L [Thlaspida biramosa]
MDFLSYSIIFCYLGGLLTFLISLKHFLLILLSLEFMMLAIFLGVYFFNSFVSTGSYFSMIYLTVVVCEGVLGLSIMVSIIRSCGNDNLMSLSCLW